MKTKLLYAAWASMFILCAALGSIQTPTDGEQVVLILFALAFFVPGGLLLADGLRLQKRRDVLAVRWISLGSLVITFALILANFFSANASAAVGDFLHGLLLVLSAPMFCAQHWVLSLFLWSCLLFSTFIRVKK